MLVYGKKQNPLKIKALDGDIKFIEEDEFGDYDFTNECMKILKDKGVDLKSVNSISFIRDGKIFHTEKELVQYLRNEFSIREWEQSDAELLTPFRENKDVDKWMYEEYDNEVNSVGLYNVILY